MKKGLEGGFEEVEPDLKISGGKEGGNKRKIR
jgi:hypothetical protein